MPKIKEEIKALKKGWKKFNDKSELEQVNIAVSAVIISPIALPLGVFLYVFWDQVTCF